MSEQDKNNQNENNAFIQDLSPSFTILPSHSSPNNTIPQAVHSIIAVISSLASSMNDIDDACIDIARNIIKPHLSENFLQ